MIADDAYPVLQAHDDQHCGCTCLFFVPATTPDTVQKVDDPFCPYHELDRIVEAW
jgi:hypothetical protein